VIYDRAHTREIAAFGGLAQRLPEYAALTGLAFMASLGLPGLAGFVGEVLVFLGGFGSANQIFRWYVVASVPSVVITAAYYLWTMHRMFLGPAQEKWAGLWDVNWRERLTLYPLGAVAVILGSYPMPIFDLVNPALHELVARTVRMM
jgi:NADH-quinone oxidoreductase subunit M